MSSVDNRIVKMQFDNAQFKKGAAETQTSLANLNKAVDSTGKSRGLLDLNNNLQRVQVTASKMAVATTAALGTIVSKATTAGLGIVKSLSLDPLKQGFDEYELKMKSIQTIMANTKGENLKSITKALDELNEYSDKTIYNFANMTQNIGKLTTAGIDLKTATSTVKGFSNMVALAGGDAEAAAGAMEQFGQGLQAGVIKAIDWQSISTRGLGSQSLQKAFFETARAAGKLKDVPLSTSFEEWTKKSGGFKGSLEKGWLTTDTATKTLSIMTGDIKSVQKLMKMGFDKKTAKDMLAIADNALESATKVRTFTAFMGTLKEQLGSGWSQVMESVVGDFNEATDLFTGLSDASGKAIGGVFTFLSETLKTWNDLGGRMKILEGFKNLLAPIGAILKVIKDALAAAFPGGGAGSGKALYALSAGFAAITKPLRWLADIISMMTKPLTVFFQIIKIGGAIVGGAVGYIVDFVKSLVGLVDLDAPSSGGIIGWLKDLGKAIADTVGWISDMIDKGASLKDIFKGVKFKMPKLPSMPDVGGLFGGGKGKAAGAAGAGMLGGLSAPMSKVKSGMDAIKKGFAEVSDTAKTAGGDAESAADRLWKVIKKVGDVIGELVGKINFEDVLASFNLAVLSTFVLSFSKLMNAFAKTADGFGDMSQVVPTLLTQTGQAAKSLQTQARAKLIINIAIALGILAVSLWVLSKIPAKKLAYALGALGLVMVILNKGMAGLVKMVEGLDGKGVNLKLIALSASMVALGLALILLATAFKIMDSVNVDGVAKGLITIQVVMSSFTKLGEKAEKSAKSIFAAGVAIGIVSASMVVLAGALLLFDLVEWDSMTKAGVALAGITLAVGALALIPYEGIAKVGLALLATSVGMVAMAMALIMFAKVDWESIKKLAVVLGALAIAMVVMAATGGAGMASVILALSAALIGFALAGLMLNKVNWSSIAKIGAILLILTLAIAALGFVLTVFLYAIAPVTPVLFALAAGFALFGLGMLAFAGAMAIAIALGAAGTAAFAALATGAAVAIAVFLQTLALQAPIMKKSFLLILQNLIDTIVEAVPMIIQGIKDLWAAVKKEFQGDDKKKDAHKSGESMIQNIGKGLEAKIPAFVEKAGEIIVKFLKAMKGQSEEIAEAGADLIVSILRGIGNKASDITEEAGRIVIKLAEGLGENAQNMVDAGITMIADFLHALADAIRKGSKEIGGGIKDVASAMKEVGVDMMQGLIDGIESLFESPIDMIKDLFTKLPWWAKKLINSHSPSKVFYDIGKFIVQGLTNGVQNNAAAAIQAVGSMVGGQIAVANEYISKFIQDLDQNALAARAKAEGLAAAAERAAAMAGKTKSKKDDRAAANLEKQATAAEAAADAAEGKAQREKDRQERIAQFNESTLIEKAQMRSEDAQTELDAVKASEAAGARKLAQAAALERQARAAGVSPAQRKQLRREAAALRAGAVQDAKNANAHLANARSYATSALDYQKQAGEEAANAFEAAFRAEAKTAEDEAAFDKLTDAEKAEARKKQAEELQSQAEADLKKAKELAYTDLEAANELAAKANEEADRARMYLQEAAGFESSSLQGNNAGGAMGTVINLDPSDLATVAFNEYAAMYDSANAALAAERKIEFNQYNTSPESLSDIDIYRQTNNLFTYAADQIVPAA